MSLQQVREFHEKYGIVAGPIQGDLLLHDNGDATDYLQTLAEQIEELHQEMLPGATDAKENRNDHRLWRLGLLLGELAELAEGLAERDEVKVADALGDINYANDGTALAFDIPLEHVVDEIHRSNMTKAPTIRPKGPSFVEPNLRKAIDKGRDLGRWEQKLKQGI